MRSPSAAGTISHAFSESASASCSSASRMPGTSRSPERAKMEADHDAVGIDQIDQKRQTLPSLFAHRPNTSFAALSPARAASATVRAEISCISR